MDITRHPLITQAYKLCLAIETGLEPSAKATEICVDASALLNKLNAIL